MKPLNFCINRLEKLNSMIIGIGRSLAWMFVAAMVFTIVLQVFFRYVLNNALPWPEEVARALMIWMMALVAASAYREGSFVSIDMLQQYLPNTLSRALKIILLLVAMLVLYQLFVLGLEFFQRGFRTRAATFHLSRAWVYLAMPVCFGSMLLVNLELTLKELRSLCGYQAPVTQAPSPC